MTSSFKEQLPCDRGTLSHSALDPQKESTLISVSYFCKQHIQKTHTGSWAWCIHLASLCFGVRGRRMGVQASLCYTMGPSQQGRLIVAKAKTGKQKSKGRHRRISVSLIKVDIVSARLARDTK